MGELLSSAGLPICCNTDPVYLTNTAYGNLAEALLKTIACTAEEGGLPKRRRRTHEGGAAANTVHQHQAGYLER